MPSHFLWVYGRILSTYHLHPSLTPPAPSNSSPLLQPCWTLCFLFNTLDNRDCTRPSICLELPTPKNHLAVLPHYAHGCPYLHMFTEMPYSPWRLLFTLSTMLSGLLSILSEKSNVKWMKLMAQKYVLLSMYHHHPYHQQQTYWK